mmetsp:Transcript_23768/g.33257  ORF Transcript_23768/g.33257 Transcript_23768/m.33257 type:complete len:84 (+) Transcript_23768:1118-1369(+)
MPPKAEKSPTRERKISFWGVVGERVRSLWLPSFQLVHSQKPLQCFLLSHHQSLAYVCRVDMYFAAEAMGEDSPYERYAYMGGL